LASLGHLGDIRIAGELVRRYQKTTDFDTRRPLANAAHHLGATTAMEHFAKDIEGHKTPLPKDAINRPGAYQTALQEIIRDLSKVNTPAADRALFAIAKKGHRYHKLTAATLMSTSHGFFDEEIWFGHTYCLKILRDYLDDTTKTGGTYRITNGYVEYRFKNGSSSSSIPKFLSDPNQRLKQVPAKICDQAAIKLSKLVFGLPRYHPLQKQAKQNLTGLKKAFDRMTNGFRPATDLETEFLQQHIHTTLFLPRMPPLKRPATKEDVKKGLAIFSLEGKRSVAKLHLPAVAKFSGQRVLIVQAEKSGRNTMYGVIGMGIKKKVTRSELSQIKSMKRSFSLFNLFNH